MSTSVTLFGDSLRDAARPWLEELGKSDRDRLQKLLHLSFTEKTRLSEALNQLFPGEDTQTALANLTRLRNRLNEAGTPLNLRFQVDTKKKSPPTERTLWFTGPDGAVLRATHFSQQLTADVASRPFIPSKGIATTGSAMAGNKIFVRFFVSYARANKDLADSLIEELKSQFGCSKRYAVELWMDQDTTLGDRWHERIQAAIQASDFGLLLVGPEFLNRKYIKEHELPQFLGNKKPIFPVGLIKVDFHEQDLLGLAEHQIFRLPGKNDITRFYEEMSGTTKKREFAHQLFLAIQKRLDASFATSPQSDAGTHACSEDEKTPELQARVPASPDLQRFMPPVEETRHFQRTRGLAHHLAARESIDPAKASTGEARDALDELEAWAVRPEGSPFFALLGEVGLGKTTTLKQFTRQLIAKRQVEPEKYPLPIYIDLRDYVGNGQPDAVPTIEELLTSVIQRSWRVTDRTVTAADLLRLVREEGALILFDGLDEKIVHLTPSRARDFIRTLWSVLPQAMLPQNGAIVAPSGKLLISCRSHYFRDVWSQNAMLTGEDREGIDRSQYPAFCLLPFDEAQIRGYLTSFLGDEKRGSAAFDLIASIHNLRDLAERPYLLSLISGRLGELETLKMRDETVNASRLYDLVVRAWLGRDDGKHHLDPMHKRRLMESLAAALWRSGEKQWDVDRLEEWFDEFLHQNPAIASAYANKNRSLLKEDLRTATFVLRPDTEAKHFRFAHTSLQEYFLASHLTRALVEKADAEWDMPMVSLETLDFIGQILATGGSGVTISSIERILGDGCLQAAVLAFKYWLEAINHGHPEPQPKQVNLAGANLEEWHIKGYGKGRPLNLRGANLSRAHLSRSRLEHVDLAEANLNGLEARQALFLEVTAPRAHLTNADVAGLNWHGGTLDYCEVSCTNLELAELWNIGLAGLPKIQPQRTSPNMCKLKVYTGHKASIHGCAWSPTAPALVSASGDSTLKIWDASSGRELLTLVGHGGFVRCCAWGHEGGRLLSGSEDKTLKIWDLATGEQLRTFTGHLGPVHACGWSPDGRQIVSASWDKTLKVWDVAKGEEVLNLNGHTGRVYGCMWSPDGSQIVSASWDRTLKIWDAKTGREIQSFGGHSNRVSCCAWSPDGSRIASGSWDKTLKIWDAKSGQELLELSGHVNRVNNCTWNADSSKVLSASQDYTLKVWNAYTGKEEIKLSGHVAPVHGCYWSRDNQILSGAADGMLKIWDIAECRELLRLDAHSGTVNDCQLSPLENQLVIGSSDKILRLWDAVTGKERMKLIGHSDAIQCCRWNLEGNLIVSASWDGTLRIWNVASGEALHKLAGNNSPVSNCRWNPDGGRILSSTWDGTLQIWDSTSGKKLLEFGEYDYDINSCAWSPDGTKLLTGDDEGMLKVLDAETGREVLSMSGHDSSIYCCSWSPDGKRLLSGGEDKAVNIWDATSGHLTLSLAGHSGQVRCCAWNPKANRILSGSLDGTLKVWDAITGQELLTLVGENSAVCCSTWSVDENRVFSGHGNNTVKAWNATTGQCIWTGHLLPENQSAVISGDGTQILHATPEAWRWLGWEERDAKGRFIRRLPAEAFGPIPGMED